MHDTATAHRADHVHHVTVRELYLLLPPFALALYPVFFTWISFPTLADVHSLQRAITAAIALTAVLLVVARILCGTLLGASVGVSIVYLGALCYLAARRSVVQPPTQLFLGAMWVAGIVFVAAFVARRSMAQHHRVAARAIGLMVVVVLSQVITPLIPTGTRTWEAEAGQLLGQIGAVGPPPRPTPDIYYIVLDAYGRSDVLSREYAVDNRDFLDALRSRGFYVADSARSNYVQTDLSLASALNMTYLDALGRGRERNRDRDPARYLIHRSEVARLLRNAGYEFVLIGSDYAPTMALADVDDCECPVPLPGWFELLLARGQLGAVRWLEPRAYRAHAHQVLSEFDALARAPHGRRSRPRFVFAHIVAPHPPFVFRRDGTLHVPNRPFSTADASQYPGTQEEYRTGYGEQLLFLNTQVLPAIDAIIRESQVPPIILLQGDHGPALGLSWVDYAEAPARNRAGILAAFLVNDTVRSALYPSITPVNYFRVILGRTFGPQLPLLPDNSFYSPWLRPFSFTPIPADPASLAGP